ncbi:MAG: hypothetical protein QGH45_18860 [Myxococcota bacterium]|nr:hypothetical protein [Myxococcota bacterium]
MLGALGLAAASLLPASADAEPQLGPLVLYVGAGPEQGEQARNAVARRLGYSENEVTRTEPLMEYVFGDADLWPRGGQPALCPAGVGDVELIARIAEAEDALDLLEYSRAINALGPLSEALACITHPVEAGQLSRAAMLLGYARFLAGEREGAETAFSMAAVFDPDVNWDVTYPPDAQQVFNSAVLSALRAQDALIWPAFGSAEEAKDILVDGSPVSDDGSLRPGLHQITVKTRAEGQLRLAVTFVAGETVHLGPTRELLESFLAGGDDSTAAGDALVAALARTDDDDAYIVDPAFGRIYRFTAGNREVREIPGTSADAGTKPGGEETERGTRVSKPRTDAAGRSTKKKANPGPVLVIAGGVTGAVGLAVGLSQRAEVLRVIDDYVATDKEQKREELRDSYNRAANGARAGYVIAAIGGVTAAVGIPVWITSGDGNGRAFLILEGGAEGGSVTLSGRW